MLITYSMNMYQSSCNIDIPSVDLCSYLFDNPIYDVDQAIHIDPEDPALSLSYRQSLSYVRKLISGLKSHGLQPGDSLCLHSFNNIWYSILLIATVGARGRFVGSNPAYTTYELERLFRLTKTKFLVVTQDQFEKVHAAAIVCSIPNENIFIFDPQEEHYIHEFQSWRTLLHYGEDDWYRFKNDAESKQTPAILALTSGTTGPPKAAMLSHYTFVALSEQTRIGETKPYVISRLVCLAQFHLFPIPLVHLAPLKDGVPTYIMKRWDLKQYVTHIDCYQITETAVVTPIVLALLGLPGCEQRKLLPLRNLLAAGAPLGYKEQNALRLLCHPQARCTQVWGLTEIGWITMFPFPEADDTGSVGRLLPNMEAKIMDASNNECMTEGTSGEIVVRGPGTMLGYLDNDAATNAMIRDGWLRTGDIGYQLNGKWYIVDRVKELIKVRGWQVSPSELEQYLLKHPGVRDAAVIGVDAQDGRGELPRAYIVPVSLENPISNESVLAFMGQRLAKYKALAGGIAHVRTIPRNPSGKILKRILRERAAREVRGEELGDDALTIVMAEKFSLQLYRERGRPVIRIVGYALGGKPHS